MSQADSSLRIGSRWLAFVTGENALGSQKCFITLHILVLVIDSAVTLALGYLVKCRKPPELTLPVRLRSPLIKSADKVSLMMEVYRIWAAHFPHENAPI